MTCTFTDLEEASYVIHFINKIIKNTRQFQCQLFSFILAVIYQYRIQKENRAIRKISGVNRHFASDYMWSLISNSNTKPNTVLTFLIQRKGECIKWSHRMYIIGKRFRYHLHRKEIECKCIV